MIKEIYNTLLSALCYMINLFEGKFFVLWMNFAEFLFRRGEVKQSVAFLLPVRVVEGSTPDLATRFRAYPAFFDWVWSIFMIRNFFCDNF